MPDKKITELTELTIPAYEDLFATVDDPSGSPVTMKTTLLNLLGGPKPTSPSDYDDEFDSGTLDAKWTAINCDTGTVDLLSTAATKDTWDATMFAGMMALQPGRDDAGAAGPEAEAAMLRQTVSLAANCKVVVRMFANQTHEGAFVASNTIFGLMLSDANGLTGNDWLSVGISGCGMAGGVPEPGVTLFGTSRIGGAGVTSLAQFCVMAPKYLMITKTGNNFSAFGGNGYNWAALVDASAPDNSVFAHGAGVMTRLSIVSYFAPPAAEVNLFNPITCFDFVRYFENNTPLVYA